MFERNAINNSEIYMYLLTGVKYRIKVEGTVKARFDVLKLDVGSRKVDSTGVVTAADEESKGDGVRGRELKGWRSTIRTSHLNFSPPKPHGCPHSDLYQASFTPSSSPPSHTPPASPQSPLTPTLLYAFDIRHFNPLRLHQPFSKRKPLFFFFFESILINFPTLSSRSILL